LNPALSLEFDTILANGLHPGLHQRYQHPSELQQDILTLTSRTGVQRPVQPSMPAGALDSSFKSASTGASAPTYPFPIKLEIPENSTLLPSAEMLPQMREGNDRLEAVVLLIVTLLSFGVVTA